MKIKRFLSQSRRDFNADFECQFCGHIEKNKSGYDDSYFHNHVIPDMKCKACGKSTNSEKDESYRPYAPKYAEQETV